MALLGSVVFFLAYQQWMAWLLMIGMLCLPPLSLLLSLPAMLTSRVRVQMPRAVIANTPTVLHVTIGSLLPTPAWRVQVQVYHTLTRESLLLRAGSFCPVQHCGALNCQVRHAWVYDYLGLFRIPLRRPPNFRLLIRPTPLKLQNEPDLSQLLVTAWRPKPGGGFAENHELRLYRPGDNLHQIHWKLTAKTGKLILREPMVPDRNRMLLWLTLHGDPDTLDRKLRRLLWMSGFLLKNGLEHDVLAYTAAGPIRWHIADKRSLQRALDTLLCYGPYPDSDTPAIKEDVNWEYYIGGEADA